MREAHDLRPKTMPAISFFPLDAKASLDNLPRAEIGGLFWRVGLASRPVARAAFESPEEENYEGTMRLSRAAAYGIFATVHIAEREKDAPIPGQDIAETCSIPPGHLLKVLQQLVKSRILSSERGPSGGFALRRPANKITLLDIIESIEGPIEGEYGGSEDVTSKARAKNGVKKALDEVANYSRNQLRKTSVTDLIG